MAATLLLSRVDKQVRYQDVGRTALQCLHGLHSIETALSIFHSILSNPSNSTLSSSVVIGTFDAHVGDCACHTRAHMLWDIIEHFRTSRALTELVEGAIALLNEIKVKTAMLLQLIMKKNGNIRPLGFGSVVTTLDIFDHIGFTEFLTYIAARSNDSSRSSTPATPETPLSSDLHASATPRDIDQGGSQSNDYQLTMDHKFDALSLQNDSSTNSDSGSSRSSASYRHHRTLSVDTEWDISDLSMVIRFLTLCRIASISKVAVLPKPGHQTRIIARLDPHYAYAKNEEDLEALGLVGDGKLSNFIRPADRAKRQTLTNESEAIQVYLAQLTTDWTRKTAAAAGLSTAAQRLCSEFAMPSTRRISCVSAYLSILPIRALWLTKGIPIILVVQRFCSHGYHVIFFRVTANDSCPRTQQDFESLGNDDWFDITPITHEELISSVWAATPHITLICVSTNGLTEDFYNRLVDDNQAKLGCNKPHDRRCHEQDKYIDTLQGINFSSILMHFFAQHEQFPFALPDKQDGYDYVAKLLASELSEDAGTMFLKGRDEAVSLGTGSSARLFSFQHVYLEYPGVVARQVKGMIDCKDKPAVIGYRQG